MASAVVLASLCLAALLAVVRRGRERGAWAGMAIFGLGYLAFAWLAEGAPPPPTTSSIDLAWDSVMGPGSIIFRSMQDMHVRPPLPRRARRAAYGPSDRPLSAMHSPSAWLGVLWGTSWPAGESESGKLNTLPFQPD